MLQAKYTQTLYACLDLVPFAPKVEVDCLTSDEIHLCHYL